MNKLKSLLKRLGANAVKVDMDKDPAEWVKVGVWPAKHLHERTVTLYVSYTPVAFYKIVVEPARNLPRVIIRTASNEQSLAISLCDYFHQGTIHVETSTD